MVHDVTVSYLYETEPGRATGHESQPVKSIRFFPGYVVLALPSGECELFAVDRLRRFSYAATDREGSPFR